MATVQLDSVEFHGDTILATRGPDGTIFVAVKRVCDSIGVAYQTQHNKLRKAAWAGITLMMTPDLRGSEQETCMIPLAKLPMWMVTISAGKVRPELREKLLAYQTEASEVLARHFMPPAVVPAVPAVNVPATTIPGDDPSPTDYEGRLHRLDVLATVLGEVRKTIVAQAEQERRLLSVEVKADAALSASAGDTGFMSLLGFCRLHKIRMDRADLASVGWTLKRVCSAERLPIRTAPHEVYGKVNLYPVELLHRWKKSLTG